MDFKEKVSSYLKEKVDPERRAGGYKAMATRLSRDLSKRITPESVKKYLQSLEKKQVAKNIGKRAKGARVAGAYEWKSKYKIMLNHFKKRG